MKPGTIRFRSTRIEVLRDRIVIHGALRETMKKMDIKKVGERTNSGGREDR